MLSVDSSNRLLHDFDRTMRLTAAGQLQLKVLANDGFILDDAKFLLDHRRRPNAYAISNWIAIINAMRQPLVAR